MSKNILLHISYDGTNYHGWQMQKNAQSVSQCLTEAICQATGETNITLIGASRTDAGVHALDYPCHFHTNSSIPPQKYPLALRAFLPRDIVVNAGCQMPDDFHILADTYQKTYQYIFLNTPFSSPFERNFSWHVPQPLNVDAMNQAASYFVGTHDFLAFCSSDTTVKTTVRTIFKAEVCREGNHVIFSITGDGFLYNMVRIIAGTLREVGLNRMNPNQIPWLIGQKDRTKTGMTAPPQGLFLQKVYFHTKEGDHLWET